MPASAPQLFAAQSCNAPPLPCDQPDFFGTQLLAPRAQVITERAGHPCHDLIVRLSLRIPPSIGSGSRSVCRNSATAMRSWVAYTTNTR